jgi:non-specific serine/threonine protein kinase
MDMLPEQPTRHVQASAAPGQPPTSASWSFDLRVPALRTTFRGRKDDLAKLELLVDQARVITLTGPGGCGKTRLAIELGRRVFDRFEGGVTLVDFTPVTEPDLVTHALARCLRTQESAQSPSIAVLAERIADQRRLLILDNCEHSPSTGRSRSSVGRTRCAGAAASVRGRDRPYTGA